MIRRQILAALLVVVSFALLMMPCVAQQAQIDKEIRDQEDKMNASYAANDLPVYFAYYADDFTQWLPEGRTDLPQYKKEWTAFIRSGGKVESAQTSDMKIQIGPSGDTVTASYLLHVKTRSPKGEVSDEELGVRRVVQARWKVEGRTSALLTRAQEEVISRQRLRGRYYDRLP